MQDSGRRSVSFDEERRSERSRGSRVSFDEDPVTSQDPSPSGSAPVVIFGLLRAGGVYETEVCFGAGRRVVAVTTEEPELLVAVSQRDPSAVVVRLATAREGPMEARFVARVARAAAAAGAGAAAADPEQEREQEIVTVPVMATVMGRGKGTPQLRSTVRCVGRSAQGEETDASDWGGFE